MSRRVLGVAAISVAVLVAVLFLDSTRVLKPYLRERFECVKVLSKDGLSSTTTC